MTKPVCVQCFRAMREYCVGMGADQIDRNSKGSETMHAKNFIIEVRFKCDYHQNNQLVMTQDQLDILNSYPIKKIRFNALNFNNTEKTEIQKKIKEDAAGGNVIAQKALDQMTSDQNNSKKIKI